MTKEQEAIKYIEKRIKICNENADICDDNDFDEEATCLREEGYMLETVLNMLKEKDKKINSKSSSIKALQCALYERTEERDRKNNIIAKQNKMIDLMAEYLDEDDTSLANYLYRKNGKCNSEMVKQYFKSKAEKE